MVVLLPHYPRPDQTECSCPSSARPLRMFAPVPRRPTPQGERTMTPMSRRDLLRTAGAGGAMLALPSVTLADDPPAKGGAFTLPPLPYAFDALEPYIDAKTMEIHHDRHHKAYVDNLNKAVAGTEWVGRAVEELLVNLAKLPEKVRNAVRNNGGGHYTHSLFWQMMAKPGSKPSPPFTEA